MNDPFADDPTNPFETNQPATAVPAAVSAVDMLADDDDFAMATDEYIRLPDLDGRLLLVIPLGNPRTAVGDNGKPYEYHVCDIVVLDGPTSKKLPKVPGIYPDVRFSSERCFNQVEGARRSGKMMLGRLGTRPGKFGNSAYGFTVKGLTNADVLLARRGATVYKASRATDNPFA